MFVPEKLRLNLFKPVLIPKNSEFVKRYGLVASPSAHYTGDVLALINQDKIQSLMEGERIMDMLNKEDEEKSKHSE